MKKSWSVYIICTCMMALSMLVCKEFVSNSCRMYFCSKVMVMSELFGRKICPSSSFKQLLCLLGKLGMCMDWHWACWEVDKRRFFYFYFNWSGIRYTCLPGNSFFCVGDGDHSCKSLCGLVQQDGSLASVMLTNLARRNVLHYWVVLGGS